ncbi:MAG: hypothetical protein JWQ10_191 [Herbaspirillum sp.]|nr:hypothetical protein [Herbaspirillum sp.]
MHRAALGPVIAQRATGTLATLRYAYAPPAGPLSEKHANLSPIAGNRRPQRHPPLQPTAASHCERLAALITTTYCVQMRRYGASPARCCGRSHIEPWHGFRLNHRREVHCDCIFLGWLGFRLQICNDWSESCPALLAVQARLHGGIKARESDIASSLSYVQSTFPELPC